MTISIYNSLSGEKEGFEPLDEDTVRMYVCGQTVYDNMHIGHARTYIAFDIIRRHLEHRGYAVETVINVTDVNDKINDRADEEGRDPWDVAGEYTRINLEDFEALGVRADAYPKASEYVQEMIDLVAELEENGYAYEVDGDVFFDVRAFDGYGKLSNQDVEDIRAEREDDIVASEKKRHPEDFVLWRARTEGPTWDSPWGEGVPGWHIECSAMSRTLLGDQFDIHGGGSDLVFPHHEDEIAQTEACTGTEPWVRYWMHSGLVQMGDDKMSKSLGNFVPSRDLLEEFDPEAIRLMVAGTHYRKPMEFSRARIEQAEEDLDTLRGAYRALEAEIAASDLVPGKLDEEDRDVLERLLEERAAFLDAMDDDFNTPEALKHLHEIASLANGYVDGDPERPVLERARDILLELTRTIGVLERERSGERSVEVPLEAAQDLADLRDDLRAEEEYAVADEIRTLLENWGFDVEDTDSGTRLR